MVASAGVFDAFSVLACRQGQGEPGCGGGGPERPSRSRKPRPSYKPAAASESGDLDLRALGQALVRKRSWVIVPTVLAAVLSIAAVNLVTPRYKSEARILIDGRENVFLRPNGERNEERNALDAEAVTSQVQLLLSRDLAREIIKKNKLAERPEFDPVLQGLVAAEIACWRCSASAAIRSR